MLNLEVVGTWFERPWLPNWLLMTPASPPQFGLQDDVRTSELVPVGFQSYVSGYSDGLGKCCEQDCGAGAKALFGQVGAGARPTAPDPA